MNRRLGCLRPKKHVLNKVVVFDNFGAHRIWQVEAARKSHSWDPATSCVWGGPYIPKARPDATDGTDPFDPPDHAPTHLWQVIDLGVAKEFKDLMRLR